MVSGFERIVIATEDPQQASEDYRQLLGVAPMVLEGSGNPLFLLPNTAVELTRADTQRAAISGLILVTADGTSAAGQLLDTRGLHIRLSDGLAAMALRAAAPAETQAAWGVDHIVLRTANAEACIDLFGSRLGIRLALDQTVPEWGGRMLFFRAGKLTLEVIEAAETGSDYFWGIAYQCGSLDTAASALEKRGVQLSAIRPGRKPGTRVATVKSHCLGIPTLLIEKS
jgi:hypothetical protein